MSGAYRLGSRPWPGCGCVGCARPWPEMTCHLLKQFVGCLVRSSCGPSTLRCNVNWSNLKGEKGLDKTQLFLAKDKLEDTDVSQYSENGFTIDGRSSLFHWPHVNRSKKYNYGDFLIPGWPLKLNHWALNRHYCTLVK